MVSEPRMNVRSRFAGQENRGFNTLARRRGTTPSCSRDRHRRRSSYGTRHTDLFYLGGAPGTASVCARLLARRRLPASLFLHRLYSSYSWIYMLTEETTLVNNSARVTLSERVGRDKRASSARHSARRRHRRGAPLLFVEPRADKFAMSCARTASPRARYVEYERSNGDYRRTSRFPVCLTVQLMNDEQAVVIIT